jgi:hypothetical protein
MKMNRLLIHFLSLLIILSAAFSASSQMKSDPVGTWGGSMTTEAGTSGVELTLAHDGQGWKGTMRLRPPQGQEITPPVKDLRIDDADISFIAERPRNVVKFSGKFAADKLDGTIEAWEGEQKIRSGTFALTFGGAMPAQQPATGQMADPNFDARVEKPAYKSKGPRVLFDEAHNNFHTAGGRYKPFADLITNDGYQIVSNKEKFSATTLKGYQVLVISNALGAPQMGSPEASNPAFTDAESDAVRDWVRAGGSLLLIADHAPMGAANQILATRFQVDMSKMFTIDPENADPESQSPSFIVYTRESGHLADHPITRGRNAGERVNKVIAFTGQSLKGPADSFAFMKLADTAKDTMPGPGPEPISAAGRAQGLAMKFGKGRLIVMGEAGMLSAQIVMPQGAKFGMNRAGIDNRQLALNMMHWLSGLLR